jgi:threonine dehydrogenase-like Zn-dependent dehydrogenase
MRTVAEDLIAEAAKSPQHEAWISRQLMAQRRPSEILADLDRAIDPAKLVAAIGGDGPVGLITACLIAFATPFLALGWLLP